MPQVRETKSTVARNKNTEVQTEPTLDTTHEPTATQKRFTMIQVAAYLRAEKRGFKNGDPVKDWLEAEREVEATLTAGRRSPRAHTN